jgi:hypothetical protein
MFKKKTQKPADPAARRNDLAARLSAAEDRLMKLRADAVTVASSDPDKLPALSEQAARTEFEIAALTEALRQAEQAIEMAAEAARQEADKAQREATSHELRKIAIDLERAAAPLPDNLESLRIAIVAAQHVIGDSGFTILLANLRDEVPAAMKIFVDEIRRRADETLAGTAPATMPAPFVPTIVKEEEALPEITVFVLDTRVTWPVDASGRRANLGPYQIGGVPEFWAKIALERGLAIAPDSPRYKQMRAEATKTGWPHVHDPMAVRDLDRDPDMVSVHNRATGKKVRDEIPKFENYRAGEPPYQVGLDMMLPK